MTATLGQEMADEKGVERAFAAQMSESAYWKLARRGFCWLLCYKDSFAACC